MVARIWHGRTTPENADAYEELLREEVIPGIHDLRIPGFRGIQVLRRRIEEEVEFVTLMQFESLDSVIAFQGEDYETAYVPPKARELLSQFDERSRHYEMRMDIKV